eukprot:CAMPEP_0176135596 /NCGR_PEP_ID=MMETSP0120_2-20121206/68792_1 /TAXON_ID=160619 /ORGANISM="Kryptoperidinium foliaceum, Strain CCMP 1326" /LENGTH=47 /DNA_ID= /DNA_START= /DNA_END= /DNA_ORIENTATION=
MQDLDSSITASPRLGAALSWEKHLAMKQGMPRGASCRATARAKFRSS